MSVLQELNPGQMSELLVGACQKHVLVTVVTIQRRDQWLTLYSRFLAIDGGRLIFEIPTAENVESPVEDILPAEKVCVSFKHKHHKHLFNTTVLSVEDYPGPEGPVKALVLGCPATMQQVKRRAFYRARVPSNRIVRVVFWLGGCKAEPTGTGPTKPVWSGNVEDISAGGFQARARGDAGMWLDVGDMVGLRMTFGVGVEGILANAQFRHCKPTDGGVLLGFQFVGLGQTDDTRDAHRLIIGKVCEYQRLDLRSMAPSEVSIQSGA